MKRLFVFLILIALFALPVFAQEVEENNLSPGLYLLVTIGLAVGSWVFGTKRPNSFLNDVIKSASKKFISYEAIDKSVEAILQGIGIPQPFADWVGDVIAGAITKVPDLAMTGQDQLSDIVSAKFANLNPSTARKLLQTSSSLLDTRFARKRAAKKVLTTTAGKAIVKKAKQIPDVAPG